MLRPTPGHVPLRSRAARPEIRPVERTSANGGVPCRVLLPGFALPRRRFATAWRPPRRPHVCFATATHRERWRNDVREDLAVLTCEVEPCSPVESAVLAPHSCACPTCSEPDSDEAAREAARIEAEMDADWEADRADITRLSRRDADEFAE